MSGTLATGDRSNTYSGDNASYEYARGWVAGNGLDNYKFSGRMGTLTDFETFQIDIDYKNGRINIEDFNTGTRTDYEILFSGDLEPTADTDGGDNISGGRATGAVAGGIDAYEFTGEFFGLTIQDHLKVEPTYKPYIDDLIVSNRDNVEHTFNIKAIETSGSSDQTIMEETITLESGEQTILTAKSS